MPPPDGSSMRWGRLTNLRILVERVNHSDKQGKLMNVSARLAGRTGVARGRLDRRSARGTAAAVASGACRRRAAGGPHAAVGRRQRPHAECGEVLRPAVTQVPTQPRRRTSGLNGAALPDRSELRRRTHALAAGRLQRPPPPLGADHHRRRCRTSKGRGRPAASTPARPSSTAPAASSARPGRPLRSAADSCPPAA